MRVLLVQYAGDFREAMSRRTQGQGDVYYGHGYVLSQLDQLQDEFGQVGLLCCLTPDRYVETLASGVQLLGAAAHPERELDSVIDVVKRFEPTHLVVLAPLRGLISWAGGSGLRVICLFADSFEGGLLRRLRRVGLASTLNGPSVEWVANHNVPACRSLLRLGVQSGKVLPWDWPHHRSPGDLPPKAGLDPERAEVIYVGSVVAAKGVADLIKAVAWLRREGVEVRLRIVGQGELAFFKRLAHRTGVSDAVEFAGLVPNDEVFDLMRSASAVVIPSRHRYPEGLPLTIYEALCARTPIVASDHPMFTDYLVDGLSALTFPEGNFRELARCIQRLLRDPALYRRLSQEAQATWERLQVPVEWGVLIRRWLRGAPEDLQWIESFTMKYRS